MKYVVFFSVLGFGVPLMALGAALSARIRGWLVTALIAASCLDVTATINFFWIEIYRGSARGFEITLTDLIALALVLALIVRFPERVRWWPYNSLWMGLYFALACLSFTMVDSQPILTGFALWKLVRIYLVYWCVYNCLATGVPLVAILRGMVIIAVVFIATATKEKYIDGIYRVRGTLYHPNSLSSYLLPVMPFLAFWGLGQRRPASPSALALVLLSLCVGLVVIVSQSRVGLTLMLVMIPTVLLLANRWRRVLATRVVSGVVMGLLILAAMRGADTVWDRFVNAPQVSGAGRLELNETARLMMKDHPFLGIGLNQYSHLATVRPEYRAHLVIMANDERQGVVHHMYWLTAAEMGIPGLLVYLIIIGRFWLLAVRYAWRRGSFESLLLAGYMLGVGAVHLQALYEWVLRQTSVAYMFVIMSAMCAYLGECERAARATLKRRPGFESGASV